MHTKKNTFPTDITDLLKGHPYSENVDTDTPVLFEIVHMYHTTRWLVVNGDEDKFYAYAQNFGWGWAAFTFKEICKILDEFGGSLKFIVHTGKRIRDFL